ncbi:IS1 family transposase [Capnocytophaga canis]|uniref:IS1 family transposase n=1 Tax=Capnocytophaga canis TaxID=1848903 RepID=UPI001562BCB8|nr:IS1 family transposase [Capnocytophaga canis]
MANTCGYCQTGMTISYGRTKGGNGRVRCTQCGKTKVIRYLYRAYHSAINDSIVTLTKEGLGIRSTARVLGISTTTLLARLLQIAKTISKPIIGKGKVYEVDEICTFVGNKQNKIWIVYALERSTRAVVSFNVGVRTNKTLSVVLKTLKLADAKRIYTDNLKQYKTLICKFVHKVVRYGTNHIERKNLSVRTHLKRLTRRTLCFSKSVNMLKAILRIYFWNGEMAKFFG